MAAHVENAVAESCPRCGRSVCQISEWRRLSVSSGRYSATRQPVVVDPTWRHDDGTVAIGPDGALVCQVEICPHIGASMCGCGR